MERMYQPWYEFVNHSLGKFQFARSSMWRPIRFRYSAFVTATDFYLGHFTIGSRLASSSTSCLDQCAC